MVLETTERWHVKWLAFLVECCFTDEIQDQLIEQRHTSIITRHMGLQSTTTISSQTSLPQNTIQKSGLIYLLLQVRNILSL